MFLYSAVSSPWVWSRRCTLHPVRPVHSNTNSGGIQSLGLVKTLYTSPRQTCSFQYQLWRYPVLGTGQDAVHFTPSDLLIPVPTLAVSSPWDWSRRCTLHPVRPAHSNTNSGGIQSLGLVKTLYTSPRQTCSFQYQLWHSLVSKMESRTWHVHSH